MHLKSHSECYALKLNTTQHLLIGANSRTEMVRWLRHLIAVKYHIYKPIIIPGTQRMIPWSNNSPKDHSIQVEYYYKDKYKAFESCCYERKKTSQVDVWVLQQISDLTAGKPGRHSSAWGSHFALVNDDSTVTVHWSVCGCSWKCVGVCSWVLFGTLHHTAAQLRARKKVGQTKGRPEVTGSTLETSTHRCVCVPIHLNRCTHIHEQTDRCTPSSQAASHLGDSYFRKERSIRTQFACSSPPCLLCYLLPLAFLVTTTLFFSFLRQHNTSHRFHPRFNLGNSPNLSTLFHPLCVFLFPPCTLSCVTPESRLADKVTVS